MQYMNVKAASVKQSSTSTIIVCVSAHKSTLYPVTTLIALHKNFLFLLFMLVKSA